MKKYIFTLVLAAISANTKAQNNNTTFKGYFYNDEYSIYMNIDFHQWKLKFPIIPYSENFQDI